MTVPSGDPVEQRAARNAGQVPEFYRPPAPKPLGDPASDPPMTVRVQGGHDRAVRYSATARRAIRTTSTSEPWVLVAGPPGAAVGGWATHADVAGWPVVADVVNQAAFARHGHVPSEGALRVAERGDMDVDAFKGGRT